jgi:hypothetical protein
VQGCREPESRPRRTPSGAPHLLHLVEVGRAEAGADGHVGGQHVGDGLDRVGLLQHVGQRRGLGGRWAGGDGCREEVSGRVDVRRPSRRGGAAAAGAAPPANGIHRLPPPAAGAHLLHERGPYGVGRRHEAHEVLVALALVDLGAHHEANGLVEGVDLCVLGWGVAESRAGEREREREREGEGGVGWGGQEGLGVLQAGASSAARAGVERSQARRGPGGRAHLVGLEVLDRRGQLVQQLRDEGLRLAELWRGRQERVRLERSSQEGGNLLFASPAAFAGPALPPPLSRAPAAPRTCACTCC